MKRIFSVYVVRNKRNGMQYVGITTQVADKRWAAHISQARRGIYQTKLHIAIRRFGANAFEFEVICFPSSHKQMLKAEKTLIQKHGTLHPGGYNMTIGGQGTVGYKWRKSDRMNLSKKKAGIFPAKALAASIAATCGVPLSASHRAKISASNIGKKMPPKTAAHKAKIKAAFARRRAAKIRGVILPTTRIKPKL